MSEQRSFVPTPNEIEDLMAQKDAHIKEQWVKTMEIRLVRDELNKCYKGEGVNATEHCKDLALRYLGMLKSHKMEGFRKIEKEEAPTHL